MIEKIKSISGWYWIASIFFLGWGIFYEDTGFYYAIFLAGIQVIHFLITEKGIKSFPVQLRMAYFFILLVCSWQPLRSLYWIPFIGTSAMVFFDYCLLARLLSLLPWVRKEAFSMNLVRKTIFSKPVKGCILDKQNRP